MEYKTINETEYIEVDSDSSRDNYYFERKNFINSLQTDNRNIFVFKNNVSESYPHIGEVAASIVGQNTIGNFCYCELAQREIGGSKPITVHGVNSYYYCSSNDKTVTSWYIINSYFKSKDPNCRFDYHDEDIKTCLNSIQHYMYSQGKTYADFLKVRQQFIDMIVFDCKFGNYDRRTENWCLYKNAETGEISLYPMFDNEAFLGLGDKLESFGIKNIDSNSKSYQILNNEKIAIKNYNKNMQMKPFIPSDREQAYSSYEDIMKYLLDNYSYETIKAYRKIEPFSLSDLENLLDEFSELPKHYKIIAIANFIVREMAFNKIFLKVNRDEITDEKSL